MLTIEHPETGEEIEVYTPDEIAEKEQLIATKEEELAAALAEAEKYKAVSAEKTENFKKLNELTQEEREALTANQIAEMKRNEALEAEIEALKTQISGKEQQELEYNKAQELKKYYGTDEELKAKLEENWELVNITGVDIESIQRRAQLAAAMTGVTESTSNPLHTSLNGSAPKLEQVTESEKKIEEAANLIRKAEGRELKEDNTQ